MTKYILNENGPARPVSAQVDAPSSSIPQSNDLNELIALMRRSVHLQDRNLAAQNRQNDLLCELINQFTAAGRQKAVELSEWKKSNPRLARACKDAAEKLSRIQTEFIDSLSDEIDVNYDVLQDGDFALGEFVDKFGPRIIHLNSLLQVLAQLGNAPDIPMTAKKGE